MKKYVILTDNCVDLEPEQREQFGIEYPIPGYVTFPNGESKKADVHQNADEQQGRLGRSLL